MCCFTFKILVVVSASVNMSLLDLSHRLKFKPPTNQKPEKDFFFKGALQPINIINAVGQGRSLQRT